MLCERRVPSEFDNFPFWLITGHAFRRILQ
jgi:hypothetical protein